MRFKIYEHRYTFEGQFAYAANCIEHALTLMGHERVEENPDLHIYNHTCRDLEPDMPKNSIIFKPTAPTSKHFAIDDLGYANSSSLTFQEPFEYQYRPADKLEKKEIADMIARKSNKWDDSERIVWPDALNVKDDHILVIGQMPEDETVHGFSFGSHWKKLCMIVEKLKDRKNVVIKLHPRIRKASHTVKKATDINIQQQIERWEKEGHQVFHGYESIHSVLPKTRVAITENSTSGIECMMHNVPIISYGYPEYHWITFDLRILTQLNNAIDNIEDWFWPEAQTKFLHWYVFEYLCCDIDTTIRRLKELI